MTAIQFVLWLSIKVVHAKEGVFCQHHICFTICAYVKGLDFKFLSTKLYLDMCSMLVLQRNLEAVSMMF